MTKQELADMVALAICKVNPEAGIPFARLVGDRGLIPLTVEERAQHLRAEGPLHRPYIEPTEDTGYGEVVIIRMEDLGYCTPPMTKENVEEISAETHDLLPWDTYIDVDVSDGVTALVWDDEPEEADDGTYKQFMSEPHDVLLERLTLEEG